MPPPRKYYVTDTHPFVWYLADDARLSTDARIAFDRADAGEATIIIPAIALAEAVYLAEKGRIETKAEIIFRMVDNALNYLIYPLDLTIVKKSWEMERLSEIHDKSIVATAKHLGLELITKDAKIRDSGYVPTLW
jgi:PIN domain nuclease of toxin-antitoxin system